MAAADDYAANYHWAEECCSTQVDVASDASRAKLESALIDFANAVAEERTADIRRRFEDYVLAHPTIAFKAPSVVAVTIDGQVYAGRVVEPAAKRAKEKADN
jgi:hypothetical protein